MYTFMRHGECSSYLVSSYECLSNIITCVENYYFWF